MIFFVISRKISKGTFLNFFYLRNNKVLERKSKLVNKPHSWYIYFLTMHTITLDFKVKLGHSTGFKGKTSENTIEKFFKMTLNYN